jgi:hypothetical protein
MKVRGLARKVLLEIKPQKELQVYAGELLPPVCRRAHFPKTIPLELFGRESRLHPLLEENKVLLGKVHINDTLNS